MLLRSCVLVVSQRLVYLKFYQGNEEVEDGALDDQEDQHPANAEFLPGEQVALPFHAAEGATFARLWAMRSSKSR